MTQTSEWTVDRHEARSSGGMVAAKTPQAAAAGAAVLAQGGNAVDAAVACALVSAVVEPWMNGIGGGGYLLRHDSRTGASDVVAYPMISPAAATPGMFELTGGGPDTALFGWPAVVDNANVVGHRSVCVPGTVAGLSLALERYGTISFSRALAPAIELAENGFPVTWHTTLEIARDLANLRRFPATEELLCPGGIVPWSLSQDAPALLCQPDLADTLRVLEREGPRSFYEGEIAGKIVAHLREGGSPFAASDLSTYEAAIEQVAVGSYNGHEIATLGGATGGPTLLQSLALLDGMPQLADHNSVAALHIMAQAFGIAFADRFAYLADATQVEVPYAALGSAGYTGQRRTEMSMGPVSAPRAGSREQLGVTHSLSPSIPDYTSGGSTTHLSVIDRDGVAVSLTQTLLSLWGSRVTVPGTGVILNNGMMWFDPEPGRPNSVAGKKRPLSNMAPAIVVREGKAIAALGASGGRRIMNCVAQVAMNLLDHGMTMQPAVSAPRIDRSTGSLYASSRLDPSVIDGLRGLGHPVAVRDESLLFGDFSSPACVRFSVDGFEGGVDPWYYPATAAGVDVE